MSDDLREKLDLPPCDQVGFVVKDMADSAGPVRNRCSGLFPPWTPAP